MKITNHELQKKSRVTADTEFTNYGWIFSVFPNHALNFCRIPDHAEPLPDPVSWDRNLFSQSRSINSPYLRQNIVSLLSFFSIQVYPLFVDIVMINEAADNQSGTIFGIRGFNLKHRTELR